MQQVLLCWMDGISKYVYGAFRRMINRSFHLAACRRRVLPIQFLSSYGQDILIIQRFRMQRFLVMRRMAVNGGASAMGTC